jgi:membrane protease YdiL (CAAX protease family)
VFTAFVEETTFRGLVLAILLAGFHSTRGQVRFSVLCSGVLFGLWHLPRDPYWEVNVSQWVYAAFAGVGFAGVVLRTRSIWLIMLAHALLVAMNAIVRGATAEASRIPSLGQIRFSALLSVAMVAPLLFYGLYLIRNVDLGTLRNRQ